MLGLARRSCLRAESQIFCNSSGDRPIGSDQLVLMVTLAFLASAMNAARPLSVKGWEISFLKISVGMVPTSAPASAHSRRNEFCGVTVGLR